MSEFQQLIDQMNAQKNAAALQVSTLGSFDVVRSGQRVDSKEWGRDSSQQLFQFLITARHRRNLHKEQIIDRIWDGEASDQHFKVAMHGMNKALEPDRKNRSEPKYVARQGQSYQLKTASIWIDADVMEEYISLGNQFFSTSPQQAKLAYEQAIKLYQGAFLPNRLYEDWSTDERERLQVLALGTFVTLGEILLEENPMESIRLSQKALMIAPEWEDAYRLQMQAYLQKGNRPMAIKAYQQCQKVLDEEFGIDPLPETKTLFHKIKSL